MHFRRVVPDPSNLNVPKIVGFVATGDDANVDADADVNADTDTDTDANAAAAFFIKNPLAQKSPSVQRMQSLIWQKGDFE